LKLGRILHPSPASPAANRDWKGLATRQLVELGVWTQATEFPRQSCRPRRSAASGCEPRP
jgi:hypothetical protein